MSGIVNKAVEIGSLGLIKDVTGQEALEDEARRAAERSEAAGQAAITRGEEAAAPFAQLGERASLELQGLLGLAPKSRGSLFAKDRPISQPFNVEAPTPSEVLNNPFFQALSRQQEQGTLAQRAALGLAGSGGTQDALARQQLLLGNQFQQQELANRQLAQQNRFNQLFNVSQFGGNIATGQASQAGNLLTNIANAQNAASLGAAQGEAAFGGQLLQLGGTLLGGALGGPPGAALGGGLAGLGSGSSVGQQGF